MLYELCLPCTLITEMAVITLSMLMILSNDSESILKILYFKNKTKPTQPKKPLATDWTNQYLSALLSTWAKPLKFSSRGPGGRIELETGELKSKLGARCFMFVRMLSVSWALPRGAPFFLAERWLHKLCCHWLMIHVWCYLVVSSCSATSSHTSRVFLINLAEHKDSSMEKKYALESSLLQSSFYTRSEMEVVIGMRFITSWSFYILTSKVCCEYIMVS